MRKNPLIGFVGQGWIGKNYADDFERRGYSLVRYALEEPYKDNREEISECDIVFIAVPTPSRPDGFDDSHVRDALSLVNRRKLAVIKSTIIPGTTKRLQEEFPDLFIMHSPEFLTEATAARDAAYPDRNIIGIPKKTEECKSAAEIVHSVLPHAPYKVVCDSTEAELIKYGGNCLSYVKIVFINLLHNLAVAHGAEWAVIRDAMLADPRIGPAHLDPVHKNGRGAGGHCFIKDFAAFIESYGGRVMDASGLKVLRAIEEKNTELLSTTGKDIDLLSQVYGHAISVSDLSISLLKTEERPSEALREEGMRLQPS